MWYSVLIGDEEADSVSWSAVATVAVVCLAVLGTLWGSLVLVARAFGAVTEMCAGVVRSLLGQDARGDDGVQFEEQIGSSGGLFETLPGWQYWGRDVEGEALPPDSGGGPHLGGAE